MTMRTMRYRVFMVMVIALPAILWAADAAPPRAIDIQKSMMTIRVFKSGLFSAFGHEHEISALIRQGRFDEGEPSVELTVDAGNMRVMDKNVTEKDRAEIQETMLGPKVLDTGRFPEIRFRSTGVERTGESRWTVRGDLTLHGQTRPVKLEVKGQRAHYQGTAELKQRDFGITPVSVGGGAVKVKDEVRVEFQIVGKE
jgi:polyisoprenoid-binding protein YceI